MVNPLSCTATYREVTGNSSTQPIGVCFICLYQHSIVTFHSKSTVYSVLHITITIIHLEPNNFRHFLIIPLCSCIVGIFHCNPILRFTIHTFLLLSTSTNSSATFACQHSSQSTSKTPLANLFN